MSTGVSYFPAGVLKHPHTITGVVRSYHHLQHNLVRCSPFRGSIKNLTPLLYSLPLPCFFNGRVFSMTVERSYRWCLTTLLWKLRCWLSSTLLGGSFQQLKEFKDGNAFYRQSPVSGKVDILTQLASNLLNITTEVRIISCTSSVQDGLRSVPLRFGCFNVSHPYSTQLLLI